MHFAPPNLKTRLRACIAVTLFCARYASGRLGTVQSASTVFWGIESYT